MLGGLLPGTEIGRKVLGTLDADYRCTVGDLFILMDPKSFPGGDTIAEGVKGYLDELRASRPAVGFKQVMVPGDPEFRLRQERLEKGIPHPEEVWHDAEQLRSTIGSNRHWGFSTAGRVVFGWGVSTNLNHHEGTGQARHDLYRQEHGEGWIVERIEGPLKEGGAEVLVYPEGKPEVDLATIDDASAEGCAPVQTRCHDRRRRRQQHGSRQMHFDPLQVRGSLTQYYGEHNVPRPVNGYRVHSDDVRHGFRSEPGGRRCRSQSLHESRNATRRIIPMAIVDPSLTISCPPHVTLAFRNGRSATQSNPTAQRFLKVVPHTPSSSEKPGVR
jgi:hypothetical protein